jgi:hypothetical protein
MSLHLPAATAGTLPSLIDRAAAILVQARSSAEVLEARDVARDAYDAAKKAARLSKAKGAHDTLIAAAHRAQADALEIEAQAKRRLADEYDAAQERGEVASGSVRTDIVPKQNDVRPATAADVGLSRKEIHDARTIRDAELADPGIVRRVLNDKLERDEEPTRAALREAVTEAAMRGLRGRRAPSRKNPLYVPPTPAGAAWTHVYGTARAFAEWATEVNVKLAVAGLNERDDSQASNIRAVRDCANVFNAIVEQIDAQ